ncbi:hypothetical protein J6590_026988 [Homalodisca vitripennis]|nr:hypothetical protein J6590_026988 [Homalodisca vitripennis]
MRYLFDRSDDRVIPGKCIAHHVIREEVGHYGCAPRPCVACTSRSLSRRKYHCKRVDLDEFASDYFRIFRPRLDINDVNVAAPRGRSRRLSPNRFRHSCHSPLLSLLGQHTDQSQPNILTLVQTAVLDEVVPQSCSRIYSFSRSDLATLSTALLFTSARLTAPGGRSLRGVAGNSASSPPESSFLGETIRRVRQRRCEAEGRHLGGFIGPWLECRCLIGVNLPLSLYPPPVPPTTHVWHTYTQAGHNCVVTVVNKLATTSPSEPGCRRETEKEKTRMLYFSLFNLKLICSYLH